MKKPGRWHGAFALALVVLVALAAEARAATPFVVDEADVLDAATENRLERELVDLARTTGASVIVYVARSLDGASPDDAARRLLDRVRPGLGGHDQAALLLVAPAERVVGLHVSDGRESRLSGGKPGAVVSSVVGPSLAAGDLVGAIGRGIGAVHAELARARVESEPRSGPPGREPEGHTAGEILSAILMTIFAFLFASAVGGVEGLFPIPHMTHGAERRAADEDPYHRVGSGDGLSRRW